MRKQLFSMVVLMLVSTFLATSILGTYGNRGEQAPISSSVSYERDENGLIQEYEELIVWQQNAIEANERLEENYGE